MRTIIISSHYRSGVAGVVLAGIMAALPGIAAAHDYVISVDPALQRLSVEARFSSPVNEIRADSGYARRFLEWAGDCSGAAEYPASGRRLQVPRSGLRCLSYTVDLQAAAYVSRTRTLLHPANIVVSPTLWMWRPPLNGDDEIRVRFELPENVKVSVPWRRIDATGNRYSFGASPRSGDAMAVFGDFTTTTERVAGADLRIAVLRSENEIEVGPLIEWVRATAENIALAYGRFPNPAARVVLIPVAKNPWGDSSAVPFGRVVRDGGETVELLINERRPVDDYYAEWTPTHEFSHLMLPYLKREQRWVSEGFATYYQNILLARAGQYSEQEAWEKLVTGLERGRNSAPHLSPNEAAVDGIRNARMKIYWSGVSLALMADVELRRRSGGAESLDTVLGRLQQCCLPSDHSWSGPELFTKLDTLTDDPIFMDLYRRYAGAAGFPDANPLLEQLGVRYARDTLRFADDAALAWIRRDLLDGSVARDAAVPAPQ